MYILEIKISYFSKIIAEGFLYEELTAKLCEFLCRPKMKTSTHFRPHRRVSGPGLQRPPARMTPKG